jgi:hypothetical protein
LKSLASVVVALITSMPASGIMRTLHEHYAPIGEPFGKRLETMFIGMTLLLGQIEHRPFSVAKLAA